MEKEEKKMWEYELDFEGPLDIAHPRNTGEVPVQVVRGDYIMKFWFSKDGLVYRPFVNREDKKRKYSIMIRNRDGTKKIWIWTFENGITRREVFKHEQNIRISHFDMNGNYHTKPRSGVASLYFMNNMIEIGYYMKHGVLYNYIDGPYNKYVRIGDRTARIVLDEKLNISCTYNNIPAINIETDDKKNYEGHWLVKNVYLAAIDAESLNKGAGYTFVRIDKSKGLRRYEARSGRISNFFLESREYGKRIYPAVEFIDEKNGTTQVMYRKRGKPFSNDEDEPTVKIYKHQKPYQYFYEKEDFTVVKSQTFKGDFVIEEYLYGRDGRQYNERYANRMKFIYKTPPGSEGDVIVKLLPHKFEWLNEKSELDRKFGPAMIKCFYDRKELFYQYYSMGHRDLTKIFNCTVIGKDYYLYTFIDGNNRYVENSDYPSYCRYTLRDDRSDIILRYYSNGNFSEKRYECSLIKNDKKIIGIRYTDSKTGVITGPIHGIPTVLLHKPFGEYFKKHIGLEEYFPRYEDDIEFVYIFYRDGGVIKIVGLDENGTELYLFAPGLLIKDVTGDGWRYERLNGKPVSEKEREDEIGPYFNKPGYTIKGINSIKNFVRQVLEIGE